MRLIVSIGVIACALSGCNYERPTVGKEKTPTEESVDTKSSGGIMEGSSLTVAGLDLYMHDNESTGSDTAQPTFWVHANQGERTGEDSRWTLTNTQAVIYRVDDDDMKLDAAKGWFNQVENTAQLSGGVTIESGTLNITTDQVDWNNEHGTVTASSTTELRNGSTHLTATGFSLSQDTGGIQLYSPRGTITLGDL